MSAKTIGPIAQAWYRWKALRLPWRKHFLVGFDLQGNTYWEFRLTTRGPGSSTTDPSSNNSSSSNNNNPGERWRRIVQYPRSTHYSSVKVSPLWHQWLRYTRDDPPSLQEQKNDVVRQARMKQLAADADARWEAKPKVMEEGGGENMLPEGQQRMEEVSQQQKEGKGVAQEQDPWKKARATGPGEKWQPKAWTPTGTKS